MKTGSELTYQTDYSPDYVEEVFWVWIKNGRPKSSTLEMCIDTDNRGHKPGRMVLKKWIEFYGWEERAAIMDEKTREQVEQKYVSDRAKMLIKHAETGRKLQEIGMDFLENNELKSPHVALRAVEIGIELERESSNIAKLLESVSQMGDPELMAKAEKLLSKVTFKPDDNTNVE